MVHHARLRSLQAIARGIRGKTQKRTGRWNTVADYQKSIGPIVTTWSNSTVALYPSSEEAWNALNTLPEGPNYWLSLQEIPSLDMVTKCIRDTRSEMQGRKRKQTRAERGKVQYLQKRAYACGRTAKYNRTLLGEQKVKYSMEYLQLEDGTIHTSVPQVHQDLTIHYHKHFSPMGSQCMGLHDSKFPIQSILSSREAFDSAISHLPIPESHKPYLTTIYNAITIQSEKHSKVKEELARVLSQPHTLAEFQEAINKDRPATSPGMSGLTYDMLKLWSPTLVGLAHRHLVHLQVSGSVPDWWKYSWLVPIPKTEDPFTKASNLRPIILLEIMRKVWIGITIKKIQDCWEKHHVLQSSQHGYRRRMGTDAAIIQLINIMEEADDSGTPIFLSSWDIKKPSTHPAIMCLHWHGTDSGYRGKLQSI